LKAMAFEAFSKHTHELAAVAIDARMEEIYWGIYRRLTDGSLDALIEDQVIRPEDVLMPDGKNMLAVGTGWATYGDLLTAKTQTLNTLIEPQTFPRASAIAQLGAIVLANEEGVPPESVLPLYLRNNVAKKMAERIRVE